MQLLTTSGRRTMLANLRDRLNLLSEVPNLLQLFKVGGKLMLEDAGFAGRADEAVRHVLVRLIGNNDGILWLAEHSIGLGEWVRKASGSTQRFLAEQIIEHRSDAEETTRVLLQQFATDWGLALDSN